jgi:hypothetical protein
MKTCPTCSSQSTVLITNVQTGQQFCRKCSSKVCPSFLPGLIYTSEDVKLLRDCGIDPEIGNIEAKIPTQTTQTTQLVLADLRFLREAHIRIDDETFMSVLLFEKYAPRFYAVPRLQSDYIQTARFDVPSRKRALATGLV